MAHRLLPFLILFLLTPAFGEAQTLTGRVIDGLTSEPVARVEVAILDGDEPVELTVSDSLGVFYVRVDRAGAYRVVATAAGYDSLTVDSLTLGPRMDVRVELRLGPRPFHVEGLQVVARRQVGVPALQDYYYRLDRYEKMGGGLVLDREVLEEYGGERLTRVLARESIHVKETTATGRPRLIVKRRGARFIQSPWCTPAVYLDGLQVDIEAVQSLPAEVLEGIEMYRGVSQIPAEFMTGAGWTCGVIAAWTRPYMADEPAPDRRSVHVGAFVVGLVVQDDGRAVDRGDYGVELELDLRNTVTAWLQIAVMRPVAQPWDTYELSMPETPWSWIVGGSWFPWSRDRRLAPYAGAGIGVGAPDYDLMLRWLGRVGLEIQVVGPLHVRGELRAGESGWGVAVGLSS